MGTVEDAFPAEEQGEAGRERGWCRLLKNNKKIKIFHPVISKEYLIIERPCVRGPGFLDLASIL